MWKAKTIKSLKYDDSFRSNEDWDIACRLERAGGIFQFVEGVHSLYRRHGSSLNNNQYRMIETRIRCGVKNYAHIADPWISGLARLSLVLGSSMLEDNDYLMALIPGDSTDDHSIIDKVFSDVELSAFAALWCGGIIRRVRSCPSSRCAIALRAIRKIIPFKSVTWKAVMHRIYENFQDVIHTKSLG
jgi:hypothetical protein